MLPDFFRASALPWLSSSAWRRAIRRWRAHETVAFAGDYPAGVIVISQHQRKLYFTEGNGRAIRYPIAVGKPGKAWLGETSVAGKYLHPDWSPPAVVHHDHPELPSSDQGRQSA